MKPAAVRAAVPSELKQTLFDLKELGCNSPLSGEKGVGKRLMPHRQGDFGLSEASAKIYAELQAKAAKILKIRFSRLAENLVYQILPQSWCHGGRFLRVVFVCERRHNTDSWINVWGKGQFMDPHIDIKQDDSRVFLLPNQIVLSVLWCIQGSGEEFRVARKPGVQSFGTCPEVHPLGEGQLLVFPSDHFHGSEPAWAPRVVLATHFIATYEPGPGCCCWWWWVVLWVLWVLWCWWC